MSANDYRIDWFRVLTHLQAEGWSMNAVSHFTGIPRTTLLGYKQGRHPNYHNGALLLKCWSESCGKELGDAPIVNRYSFKA